MFNDASAAKPRLTNLLSFFGRLLSRIKQVFFPAFTFAPLAHCAAATFLRAAAESVRLPGMGTTSDLAPEPTRNFAQHAFWAAT